MPLISPPKFKSVEDKRLEIPQPAINGLNMKDLEYEQEVGQSPCMLNMMYRNGAFSKRYGQSIFVDLVNDVHSMILYRDRLFMHSGTGIYNNGEPVIGGVGIPDEKGLFLLFNQRLYYFCKDIYQIYFDTDEYKCLTKKPDDWATNYRSYYVYSNGQYVPNTKTEFTPDKFWKLNTNHNQYVCEKVEPYIPTITINRHPDGTSGDVSEAYNMVGTGFQNNFHGDGTSKDYYLTDKELDSDTPRVLVDNVELTYDPTLAAANSFKVDFEEGKITFKTAPPSGTNNVEIIAFKHDAEWTSYHDQVLGSKYYACFGGNNNSRLFLAGGGKSTFYYSEVYDPSYFPYTNYAKVGNSADDITGFGQQYNVLLVFKPTEIYSLTYYQNTTSTTEDEGMIGIGQFASQMVNSSIGCDCPNTIQLINNQLTWLSTTYGVCTLVSTNIIDERNVRPISRNVDHTNYLMEKGILDINVKGIYESVQSIDYDNKYFLVFPKMMVNGEEKDCGLCFVWDYEISPYIVTSSRVSSAKDLSWFLFDHFYVKQFMRYENTLVYSSTVFTNKLIILNDSFADLDFDGDGKDDPIRAYYMTPFFQFGAVEYLKTVKNLYIQCRGDTSSIIDVYYYTDEFNQPEADPESIRIGGNIWGHFSWDTFEWFITNWANTFRRKCSLKKIQMASFFFKNEQPNRDMSITHIGLQYQIIKNIK